MEHPRLALRARAAAQYWRPTRLPGVRGGFPDHPRRPCAGKRLHVDPCTTGQGSPLGPATCDAWGVCGDARKIAVNCRLRLDRRASGGGRSPGTLWRLEGDTVVGRGHCGGPSRCGPGNRGYLLLGKVPHRQATTVAKRSYNGSSPACESRKTLTWTMAKSCRNTEQLAAEGCAGPCISRSPIVLARGTNENTNTGLVRAIPSKGTT